MAKVKFNLIFNGNPIRTLEELRENFSVEDALSDYQDGRLERWLEARWFREELAQVQAIQATDRLGILAALVRIFDVKINLAVPEMAEVFQEVQRQINLEEKARREEKEQEKREREEKERLEREEKARRERSE